MGLVGSISWLPSCRLAASAVEGGAIETEERSGPGIDPDLVDSMIGGVDPSAYKSLLRNRNYRLWFTSALTTSLGDWAGLFALLALVGHLTETGSRIALLSTGGILMARLLPSLIVGPVAGVLADRYDRKRLMVFTDLVRAALFTAVAFSNDLFTLFTLTIVVELLSLLYISAKDASLPTIIPRRHLTEASQLNLLATYGPLPVGAIFATLMVGVAALVGTAGIGVSPIRLVLLANAATFLIAGIIISRLQLPKRAPRPHHEEAPGVVAELREGLAFIRDLPLIRALILGVVGVFFGAGAVVSLGQQFVASTLGRSDSDWFILMASAGSGLVVGMLGMPLLTRIARKERLFPIGLALTGAVAIVIALMDSFGLVLILGFLLGAAAGPTFVMGYTLLQEYTRDDIRARTFAAFYTGTRVALFAALALAPLVAATIGRFTVTAGTGSFSVSGLRLTILLGGVVALISAVSAGRGMYRAVRADAGRAVRLNAGRAPARSGGLFIAFEGVEGSGKSTQVKALAEALEAEGRQVVVTREPGGSPVAERVRQILLDPNSEGMHPVTEALLYAAARAEHVQRVILPALEAGKDVICDRYLHSSLAYQGFARELGDEDVLEVSRWATGGLLPDAVVLLHLDPQEGLTRVAERARRRRRDGVRGPRPLEAADDWRHDPSGDRLEREDLDFHRRVADGYLNLAKRDRGRFLVIDASADARTIARQVRSGLHAWIPLPASPRSEAGRQDRPEAAG